MNLKVCFDRVLPEDRAKADRFLPRNLFVAFLVIPLRKQWINGTTLRVRFIGGTPAEHEIAMKEARWWEECANIKFDFNNAPDSEIRISFDRSNGAWSYMGTDCASIPLDQPTMNLGFLDEGTAAHEFGHALGIGHEHQNPAGGIQWNENAVYHDLAGPPNWWDRVTTYYNVIKKYRADQVKGTEFDPESIMLYWFPASWTINGVGTSQNNKLSRMDRDYVGSPAMYPFPTPDVPVLPAKKIIPNHRRRTQASIRKPGEEDLFTFTVPESMPGRYVVNTRGKTNVVMRLFGPNSQTALISEDDDSGIDDNAEIKADLIPGDYYVQIRHVATGTGKYTIKCFHRK